MSVKNAFLKKLKRIKKYKYRYNRKLHKLFDYEDLRGGVLFMKNDKCRMIFQIQPTNFELLTGEDRDVIAKSFEKVLLSIKPREEIEFVIQTRQVNISSALEKLQNLESLDKQKFDYYRNFLKEKAKHKNIIFKEYFCVLTTDKYKTQSLSETILEDSKSQEIIKNYNAIRDELKNRYSHFKDAFESFNIQTELLNSDQVMRVLMETLGREEYYSYRPKFSNWDQKSKNSIKHGHFDYNLKNLITPMSAEVELDYLKLDDAYMTSYYLKDYPTEGHIGILENIIKLPFSSNIAFKIKHSSLERTLRNINKSIVNLQVRKYRDEKNDYVRLADDDIVLDSARDLELKYKKKKALPIDFSLNITLLEEDLDSFHNSCARLEQEFKDNFMKLHSTKFEQIEGFNASFVGGIDRIQQYRNMDTEAVTMFYPLVLPTEFDEGGILYGENESTNTLLIHDIKKNPNYNTLVIAPSGSGKSFLVKSLLLRELMIGHKIFILDVESEYKQLCEFLGGEYITLGSKSDKFINPLEISNLSDVNQKLKTFLIILAALLGEKIGTVLQNKVKNQLQKLYAKNDKPLLCDVVENLKASKDSELIDLAKKLLPYLNAHNSVGNYFSRQTNIDVNKSNLIVFDLKNIDEWEVSSMVIMEYIWEQMNNINEFTQVVFEEAWKILREGRQNNGGGYLLNFLETYVRLIRKRNGGIKVITQSINDLDDADNKSSQIILENTAVTLLLHQSQNTEKLQKLYGLSNKEINFLQTAKAGECLFLSQQKHIAFRSTASKEETKLIQT